MTKAAAALLIAMMSLTTMPVGGQARTDFSGTWTLDEARSGSSTQEGFVGPVIWVIQQTPEALSLERRRGPRTLSFNYHLEAKKPAEGVTPVAPSGDEPGHRAYWDGERLILETHQNIQGKTVTTRETLEMTAQGELVAERVLEVEHGYTLKGAQNFSAVKDFFTRRKP